MNKLELRIHSQQNINLILYEELIILILNKILYFYSHESNLILYVSKKQNKVRCDIET